MSHTHDKAAYADADDARHAARRIEAGHMPLTTIESRRDFHRQSIAVACYRFYRRLAGHADAAAADDMRPPPRHLRIMRSWRVTRARSR